MLDNLNSNFARRVAYDLAMHCHFINDGLVSAGIPWCCLLERITAVRVP